MDDAIVTDISTSLAELSSCIEKNSVKVKFSDDQSGKYLSTAIQDALNEYRKKLRSDPNVKKEEDNKKENTESINNQTKATEEATKATQSLAQQLENGESVTTKINETLDTTQDAISQTRETLEKNNETIKAVALKVVAAIGTAVKAMVTRTLDETAKRLEWVQQLNDAGVKLRGGFDETFTELSNLSKRSHDEFTKLLTSNSNMIARMNTMGLRGEREIAEMSQAIVGKYGYTVKTSDSIIKFMLDSRIKYMTEEELQTMNLTSEMDLLAKNLRASSAAFGKSTEQILAETKAREDDYTDRMLQAKYGDAYRNMKLSGLPPELIRMFLTGVPNADATRYLATSNGFQRIYNLMEANRKGLTNKETSLKTWSKIMNDRSVKRYIREANDERNIPFGTIASGSAIVKSMSALSLMQPPDLANAEALTDNNTPEINAINSLTGLKTSVNKLNNTINNKLSSSLDNLADAMDALSGVTSGTNYMLGLVNPTLAKFVYGAGAAVGSVASDVIGSMIQLAFLSRALPFVKRFGYMKGVPLAMKSTGRYMMRNTKSFVKNTPGKIKTGWSSMSGFGKSVGIAGITSLAASTANNFIDEEENPNAYHAVDTIASTAGGYATGSLIGGLIGGAIGLLGGPIGAAAGAKIGAGIGAAWGLSSGINEWSKSKSPAQSGVNTNNYNTVNENYTTQRTVYTDSEKESNDKELLANTREIANSMRWFVNNNKFQSSPMPFAVGK